MSRCVWSQDPHDSVDVGIPTVTQDEQTYITSQDLSPASSGTLPSSSSSQLTMAGSPQQQEIQPTSVTQQLRQPIYDAACLCSERFKHHLETENGSRSNYLEVEELWVRFNQWAVCVGAFAIPRDSLDAQLAAHAEVRDTVLELLYMIQDNLRWGKISLLYNRRDVGLTFV